jgi:DNA-binding beta-propeller fold protein YncE
MKGWSAVFARRTLFGAVLLALVAGCAAPQQSTRRFFWPGLPERPRIEWLKSYSNQNDFPKSGMAKFAAAVVGENEPLSFEKPLEIRSDGAGRVFVSDPGIPGVFIYDMNRGEVYLLGREKGTTLFSRPVALAIDDQANLYVMEAERKVVMVYDKNERLVRTIALTPHMSSGGGIAVDNARQHLVCIDTRGHQVAIFDLAGTFITKFGKRGDGDGEFNFPGPVTVNSKGEIIVGDSMNARIQVFDPAGKFLRKFGHRGDGLSEFQLLKGVAVDSDDNVYVTDGKGNKVEIFNEKGDYLLTFGGRYSVLIARKEAPGGFVLPQGIYIDKTDTIYVVDQANLRFQVFRYISDNFLKNNPIPGYPPPAKEAAP